MDSKRNPAKLIGQGVRFDRTRRITGYLVGSVERFNNAKRSEERDRVKHGMGREKMGYEHDE
ncbi:hypothetical protein DSECCO2_25830 [anaerobic digester metagenome]